MARAGRLLRLGLVWQGRMFAFRSDADLLRPVLGPARVSHPLDVDAILAKLRQAGVDVVTRQRTIAYSPETNGPGRLILDAEASYGALRHEYRHFLDVQAAGYPGLSYYLRHPIQFARLERRGYTEELRIARGLAERRLYYAIAFQMKHRLREVYQT